MVGGFLCLIEEGVDGINWQLIGLQMLNKFTENILMVVCFPELILSKKKDRTIKQHLRDVTLTIGAKHLMKFSENNLGR